MKTTLYLICFLTLPGCFLLEKTDGQRDQYRLKNVVFPKDRTNFPLPRIIGGEEVTPHSFPYQAGLYIYFTGWYQFCGGTLISPTWVLTAAHCIDLNPLYATVILGSHNLSAAENSTRLILNSTTFVYHEEWNITTLRNDVGLVKLPTNVTMNEAISPIRYARGSNLYTDLLSLILGWGLTEAGGSTISPVLRKVNVTILSNQACAAYYPTYIVPSHLCTSGAGIVGSCSGDSGGPLIVDGVQVGIVSFGATNCTLEYPSAFARVTEYSDWIGQYVTDSSTRNFQYSLGILMAFCLFQLFVSL